MLTDPAISKRTVGRGFGTTFGYLTIVRLVGQFQQFRLPF